MTACAATASYAQDTPPIEEGARVKVTAPHLPAPLFGEASQLPASIVVTTPGSDARVTATLASVQRIQVSRGKSRVIYGVAGAGVGLLVGGVLGGATGAGESDPEGWGALLGTIAGASSGLILGAVGGALFAPERWRTAYVQPAPADSSISVALRDGARVKRFDDGTIGVRGERDRRKGALRGAVVLGGIGAVFGGIDLARNQMNGGEYLSTVAGNALLGAVIGAFISPRGWQKLPRSTD